MTVFSKVVTGVKKRMPNATPTENDEASSVSPPPSSSQGTRTSTYRRQLHKQSSVAPDLRRFSDFMNPFPNVQPGGYTKYYQARAAAQAGGSDASSGGSGPSPYALPSLCELNQRPPPPPGSSRRPPTIQTSGLLGKGTSKSRSSGSGSSRSHQKAISASHVASMPLTAIPETSSEQEARRARATPSRSHSARPSSSQLQTPLKRRKGRLFGSGVEKDPTAAGSPTEPSLGRASSVSSSQSRSSSSHHSSPSNDSHSSDSSVEYPHTPEDASPIVFLPTTVPPSAFKFHDPYASSKPRDGGIGLGMGLGFVGDGDWEPFERPDSRSTYRTARTHFDDL